MQNFFNSNYLKNFLNSPTKKRLAENFLSLSSLQAVNYLLPLIALPYLVRTLGIRYFGLLSFAMAVITYFKMITDYGFDLSATREISKHRNNKNKIIEIFSSVMILKTLLLILSFVLLTILIFSFNKFKDDWKIYYFTFGIILGQTLFPVWFFQGIEQMRYITYTQIFAKVIFIILIFMFIREKNDYYLVPVFNSFGYIVAGIISLYIIVKKYNVLFKWQKIETLKHYFIDSFYIFVSSVASNIYSKGTVIILGLTSSKEMVGYYSMAEKLAGAISGTAQPLSKTIYPYVSSKSEEYRYKFFRKFISIITVINIVIFSVLFYFSNEILKLIFNIQNNILDLTFKILLISSYFTFLNINLTPFAYANKQDKILSRLLIFIGIIFLFLCYILSKHYFAVGTSLAITITEIILSAIIIFIIIRRTK